MSYASTGLWQDVQELPDGVERTLAAPGDLEGAAALLAAPGVRRVVALGNGAAYYVAHALWLASLESRGAGPELVAVPSGQVVREAFTWRDGDAVLAVSSSGEFRDAVEVAQTVAGERPVVALTANADSSLARHASTCVLQTVLSQRAVTHTQAVAGAVAAGLSLWARVAGDAGLESAARSAPDAARRAIAAAEAWAARELDELARPTAAVVTGGGVGWAAALETALMLKEVARIPAEGAETREGATSAMFGLDRGHLMVSLDAPGDPLAEEAVRLCGAAGAHVARLPGLEAGDPRLALLTTLPASAALAAGLALAGGHDVDTPTWTEAYYATARSAT